MSASIRRERRRRAEAAGEPPPGAKAPGPADAYAFKAAAKARAERPRRLETDEAGGAIGPPHTDVVGFNIEATEAFATSAHDFAVMQLGGLNYSCRLTGVADAVATNAALAIVGAVEPKNELEAAIGVQIAASHGLSMRLLGLANGADRLDQMQAFVSMATKAQRTTAALIEALSKHRNAGKQQVEVVHVHKHVYVAPGGQAIVTDSWTEGGGRHGNDGQAQEQAAIAHAVSATMPGQDTLGLALQGAEGGGQEALPVARRAESGSAKRPGKRQLQDGAVHERDAGAAPRDGRNQEENSRPHLDGSRR